MSEQVRDFAYWRALGKEPERLLSSLLGSYRELPETIRRATLLEWQESQGLREAFEGCQGLLEGIPFLVKDLYDVRGVPTRAGATFLEEVLELPSEDATLVRRLKELGAVYAGKTQLVEFAYGMTGENPHFGDCPHPFVKGALAGGSSSGSAWAVRQGLVPLALGTDTAGSIRVPAAFCGVYGLRLESAHWAEGVFPLAPEFDAMGWFTRSAEDMKELCEHWFDGAGRSVNARALYLGESVGFRDEALEQACGKMAERLQAVREPEMEHWLGYGFSGVAQAYFILSSRQAAQVHAGWLDIKREHYDPQVWARLNQGRCWTEAEVSEAERVKARVCERFSVFFEDYGALVMPVTTLPSPAKSAMDDSFRQDLLALNTGVSLAGLPALSLPVMLDNGRSGALQVIFPSHERMDVAPWLDRSML